MRIAFYVNWNEGPAGTMYTGVFKKIEDQVSCWQAYQHSVRVFLLTGEQCALARPDEAGFSFPVTVETYHSRLDRFRRSSSIVHDMIDWEPDVIYFRQSTFTPVEGYLVRHHPVIVEINVDDFIEFRLAPAYVYWYHRLTRGCLLRHVAGMVFVTGELSQKRYFACYRKPFAVIGNGIDLSRYPCLPPKSNSRPRLVFISAGGQAYHGVDKITRLARRFPSWHFDLIGLTSDDVQGDVPSNVVPHGSLSRDSYEPIMRQADVGLGPLALHRKQMNEACPLKVRDYLALGIPAIIGSRDTDFPEQVPFLLELPNTPDNVEGHTAAIAQFVESWRGKRVPREAVAHLDVRVKEKLRLAFFQKVIGRGA